MTKRPYPPRQLSIFFCTLILSLSFTAPSHAQQPRTKAGYMASCLNTKTYNQAACECTLDANMKAAREHDMTQWTKAKEKAEAGRVGVLNRLKVFSTLNEANLKEVCEATHEYWDIITELKTLNHKAPGDKEKIKILGKAKAVQKPIAEDIYMTFKKSHGMITISHGHTFDDHGKWLSTHNMSYCNPLRELKAIEAKMNAPARVPYFNTIRLRGDDAKRCFALRTQAPFDPNMKKSQAH